MWPGVDSKLMSEAEEKSLGERWSMEAEYYSLRVTEASNAQMALAGYADLRKRAAMTVYLVFSILNFHTMKTTQNTTQATNISGSQPTRG